MRKIYAGFFERFSSASFMYLRVFMCILLLNEQQRINKIYCIFFPPETSTELSKGYTVCVYILWREVLPYSCFRGLYLKWDHINAEQRNMEELKSSYLEWEQWLSSSAPHGHENLLKSSYAYKGVSKRKQNHNNLPLLPHSFYYCFHLLFHLRGGTIQFIRF